MGCRQPTHLGTRRRRICTGLRDGRQFWVAHRIPTGCCALILACRDSGGAVGSRCNVPPGNCRPLRTGDHLPRRIAAARLGNALRCLPRRTHGWCAQNRDRLTALSAPACSHTDSRDRGGHRVLGTVQPLARRPVPCIDESAAGRRIDKHPVRATFGRQCDRVCRHRLACLPDCSRGRTCRDTADLVTAEQPCLDRGLILPAVRL